MLTKNGVHRSIKQKWTEIYVRIISQFSSIKVLLFSTLTYLKSLVKASRLKIEICNLKSACQDKTQFIFVFISKEVTSKVLRFMKPQITPSSTILSLLHCQGYNGRPDALTYTTVSNISVRCEKLAMRLCFRSHLP